MIRNIISQKRSYTMTLPKEWVEKKGLNQGDPLYLTMDGDMIIIRSEKKHIQKEIEIKVEGEEEQFIRTTFLNLYERGYDKITFFYEKESQKHNIENGLKYVFGFEIMSNTKSSIIVESISEPSPEKYDVILRKIFLMINEFMLNIPPFLKNKARFKEEDFMQTYRYVNFCKRELNKNKIFNEGAFFESGLITYLSIIQRSIYHMQKITNKEKCSNHIVSSYVQLQKIFHRFYEAYINRNFTSLSEVNKDIKEFHYTHLSHGFENKEKIVGFYLLEISRTINRAINITRGISIN